MIGIPTWFIGLEPGNMPGTINIVLDYGLQHFTSSHNLLPGVYLFRWHKDVVLIYCIFTTLWPFALIFPPECSNLYIWESRAGYHCTRLQEGMWQRQCAAVAHHGVHWLHWWLRRNNLAVWAFALPRVRAYHCEGTDYVEAKENQCHGNIDSSLSWRILASRTWLPWNKCFLFLTGNRLVSKSY